MDPRDERTIGDLPANILATLIMFLPLFNWSLLPFIAVLLILHLEKTNDFVRFYAKQALALQIIFIILIPLNLIFIIGSIVYFIAIIILFILALLAAFNAYKGVYYTIPFTDKILNFLKI